MRCVLQREPSMAYGNHPQRLLTCTLNHYTTRKKGSPNTIDKAKLMTRAISAADTNISQITPLLGTTPRETSQLRNTNTQEDVEEILGTQHFRGMLKHLFKL